MNESLRIEQLLASINSSIKGRRHYIEKNPYSEIINGLNNRVSNSRLEKFKLCYGGIVDKSIAELKNEKYDLEFMIEFLKSIVE